MNISNVSAGPSATASNFYMSDRIKKNQQLALLNRPISID
jgi:hypothetical protein